MNVNMETVSYPWHYVHSKYNIITRRDDDYDQQIVRYDENVSEKMSPMLNNFTRDLIIELLETRRELDALKADMSGQPAAEPVDPNRIKAQVLWDCVSGIINLVNDMSNDDILSPDEWIKAHTNPVK